MRRRLIAGGIFAGTGILFVLLWSAEQETLNPDEAAGRAATARPSWQDYQEDIKAQLGARLAAVWEGRPVEAAWHEDGVVVVVFEVMGPWATIPAAMPILLRDPYGNVYQNQAGATPENGRVQYTFEVDASAAPPPWLDFKYPHHQRRVVLDPDGAWTISE